MEVLEPRRLLTASISHPLQPVTIAQGGTTTIDLKQNFTDPRVAGTLAEFATTEGNILVELDDQQTPLTVANFLGYVNAGLYNGTIIHRSIPNFVVQGGGYTPDGSHIATGQPVTNEPGISNVAGTIAMAKLGGDPNSATSEWFFNVGDNSQNLNNQNGGFTVFGSVVSGFNIVQAINSLPTTTANIGATSFQDIPVVNLGANAQPTAQNFVTVNQVFIAPKDTFTATSDLPGLVSPTISNAGNMTLSVAANQSGYAHITVTATGLTGGVVTDIFRVHVTASSTRTLDVPIGGTHPGSVGITLGPLASATAALSGPGSAVLRFTGDNLAFSGQTVSGVNLQLDGITATGTTGASNLTVAGAGPTKSFITVGDITTTGSFNTVTISNGSLLGDLNVAGTLKTIRIKEARDGTITVGSTGATLNILLPSFANENLISAEPIGIIKALSWSNLDTAPEVVQAPSIQQVKSLGNFTPGIHVTAGGSKGLGKFHVGGNIGGTWSIPGRLPALLIGGAGVDFDTTFTQPIASLRMSGSFLGSLTVPSIGSLVIRGAVVNGLLTLTAPFNPKKKDLGSLFVGLNVQQSSIVSAGSIGPINVLSLVASRITAGISPTASGAFPQAASDFASPAAITSFTSRASSTRVGFQGSIIAAASLGSMKLNTTTLNNNGNPFGFGAESITGVDGRDLSNNQTISLHKLNSPAAVTTQVKAAKLKLGDLKIQVI